MTLTFKYVLVKYKHIKLRLGKNMIQKDRWGKTYHFFIGLDLDLMTFTLKLELEMINMYLYPENEVPSYWFKSYSLNKQTHKQTQLKLLPLCICGW